MEIEQIVRRDRLVVIAGLATVVLIAWLYLMKSAADMRSAKVVAAAERNRKASVLKFFCCVVRITS